MQKYKFNQVFHISENKISSFETICKVIKTISDTHQLPSEIHEVGGGIQQRKGEPQNLQGHGSEDNTHVHAGI